MTLIERRERGKKTSAWVVFSLWLTGILVFGWLVSPTGGLSPAEGNRDTSAMTVRFSNLTREEFAAKIQGKTEEEVRQLIGSPDTTQESTGSNTKYWYYHHKTRDAITGKDGSTAQVILKYNEVERISFN